MTELDLTTLQNAKGWVEFADKPITSITNANPAVVTCPNHNFKTGRQITIFGVAGMTQANNSSANPYTVTIIDTNNFSIGIDSTSYGAYTSGGFVGVDDVILSRLISAVSSWIQLEIGRYLSAAIYTETYNGKGGNRLMVRNFPIQSVSSLVVNEDTILPAETQLGTGYLFDSRMIYLNGFSFYRGFQNVCVTYIAGPFPGDPELYLAEQICIRLVALSYNERTRTGQDSKSMAGESVHFITSELPKDIAMMLNKLRRVSPI